MCAVVCGKRSLFDDIHGSPPFAKRIGCGGNSSIRFPSVASIVRNGTAGAPEMGSQGRPTVSYLDDHLSQFRALFAERDGQMVERLFESCEKNLDSAIKSLNDLRLRSNEQMSPSPESAAHAGAPVATVSTCANCAVSNVGYAQSSTIQAPPGELELPQSPGSVPTEGLEWVDMLVKEMMSATDLKDARMRATRALEVFEKTVASRAGAIAEVLKKENTALKEQLQGLQGLLRDNHILKRAVSIQHKRHLEHEERSKELQNVKQLLGQHQEQLRMLEMNNYALTVHMRKAQEGRSIPGHFHPNLL